MTLLNQPSLTESREKKKTFRLGDEKVEEGIVCQHFFEKYKFNIKEFFVGQYVHCNQYIIWVQY